MGQKEAGDSVKNIRLGIFPNLEKPGVVAVLGWLIQYCREHGLTPLLPAACAARFQCEGFTPCSEEVSALDAALSGLNGDPALAQRVLRCAEEKPRAAKKLSVGLVFALIALLAATGIAAAAALNLFEKFGQNDRRFAEIAPQTAISAESSVAQTEKTGTVAASITNAYYDGESLLIGYSIQGFSSFEPFSPTDEQLARMRPTDAVPARLNESHLAEAFEAARQAGTPWGMATYRVAVSDHTYTDDGLDLGPWTETEDASDPDCLLAIRDFDALPETAKNRDSLSLHAAVYQYAVFDYFDGHSMYTTTERTELFPLTATVNRISRDSALFMGFETVKGAKIGLSVQVSEIRLTAKMTAVDGTFPSIPDDSWFDLSLTDEDGEAFSPASFEILDRQTMCFTFDGNGQMPTTLNASLLIVSPSGQTESIPIVLDVNG